VVTSVFSPCATSTETRESRSTAAVASSVAIVDGEPDVYTLTAPETTFTSLPLPSAAVGRRTSKREPGRIVKSVPSVNMISPEPFLPVLMKSPSKSGCRWRAVSKVDRPARCKVTSPSTKMNEASPFSSAPKPPITRRE